MYLRHWWFVTTVTGPGSKGLESLKSKDKRERGSCPSRYLLSRGSPKLRRDTRRGSVSQGGVSKEGKTRKSKLLFSNPSERSDTDYRRDGVPPCPSCSQ